VAAGVARNHLVRGGRIASESVAGFHRNGWPNSVGLDGRSASASGMAGKKRVQKPARTVSEAGAVAGLPPPPRHPARGCGFVERRPTAKSLSGSNLRWRHEGCCPASSKLPLGGPRQWQLGASIPVSLLPAR
jgi:hypothetical protein